MEKNTHDRYFNTSRTLFLVTLIVKVWNSHIFVRTMKWRKDTKAQWLPTSHWQSYKHNLSSHKCSYSLFVLFTQDKNTLDPLWFPLCLVQLFASSPVLAGRQGHRLSNLCSAIWLHGATNILAAGTNPDYAINQALTLLAWESGNETKTWDWHSCHGVLHLAYSHRPTCVDISHACSMQLYDILYLLVI